jgi:hypothetical protein
MHVTAQEPCAVKHQFTRRKHALLIHAGHTAQTAIDCIFAVMGKGHQSPQFSTALQQIAQQHPSS